MRLILKGLWGDEERTVETDPGTAITIETGRAGSNPLLIYKDAVDGIERRLAMGLVVRIEDGLIGSDELTEVLRSAIAQAATEWRCRSCGLLGTGETCEECGGTMAQLPAGR